MSKSHNSEIEMPTLYDISGSAHFYNKADFGIIVHRDRINKNEKVRIAKVKFRHLGECGIVEFQYNEANGRYTHIPELPFRVRFINFLTSRAVSGERFSQVDEGA